MKKLTKRDLLVTIDNEVESQQSDWNNYTPVIAQERAVMALTMGIEMESKGYNIFATGSAGTWRHTTTEFIVEKFKQKSKPLIDIVLVSNYQSINSPLILYFKEGDGIKFKEAIKNLCEEVKELLKTELNSKAYKQQRDNLLKEIEIHEREVLSNFEKKLFEAGFSIVKKDEKDNSSTDIYPIYNNEIISFDKLETLIISGDLSEPIWLEKRQTYYRYMDEMKEIFEDLRQRGKKLEESINILNRNVIEPSLKNTVAKIKRYFNSKDAKLYIDNSFKDILDNLFLFDSKEEEYEGNSNDSDISLNRYLVNLLIDNSKQSLRPIIKESNPTWSNLFGIIDAKGEEAHFTDIYAGSLLKASGGFLILNAEDLLADDETWAFLKRSLLNSELVIQSQSSPLVPTIALKAEKVKFTTKIILIGSQVVFDLLYEHDVDFRKLFKIVAEFSDIMPRNNKTSKELNRFCHDITNKENLLNLDDSGLKTILFYSTKMSEHHDYYSCNLSSIADLIRESSYWAKKINSTTINRQSVLQAIANYNYINGLTEEIIQQEIIDKTLMIDINGKKIGKINALVVIDRGNYSFGFPVLITAQATAGKDGLINIEKEAGLSGEIHDKGVLILEGFLRSKFARYSSLSLSMSLCFEQNYEGVEGDSATLAECCTIISSIAHIPLRQDIAITGSMNQFGEIQPVGGVSDKINGFYKICKKLGLTGKQGVIIPSRNLKNLFLEEDIIVAIETNKFHIWVIDNIEEALELLTDLPVYQNNKFSKTGLYQLVDKELSKMNS